MSLQFRWELQTIFFALAVQRGGIYAEDLGGCLQGVGAGERAGDVGSFQILQAYGLANARMLARRTVWRDR